MAKQELSPNPRPRAATLPPDYARDVCALMADALECANDEGNDATLRLRVAAASMLELLSTHDGLAALLAHRALTNGGDPFNVWGETAGRAMRLVLDARR